MILNHLKTLKNVRVPLDNQSIFLLESKRQRMGGGEIVYSAARPLYVYELAVYNFCSSILDAVHSLDPQHLFLSLELLRDALPGGHLLYQLKKHALRLFVQISQISVQLASG